MNLNRIESGYRFSEIDSGMESYFEDCDSQEELIYAYRLRNIPQMRQLLKDRLGCALSEDVILELAKETFRHRPDATMSEEQNDDKQIVDFIYQL